MASKQQYAPAGSLGIPRLATTMLMKYHGRTMPLFRRQVVRPNGHGAVPGYIRNNVSIPYSMKTLVLVLAVAVLILPGCSRVPRDEVVLFDFESDAELDRLHWNCHTLYSLSDQHATHGKRSIKLELYPAEYPGLNMKLQTRDWSRHKTLRFDVYNPGNAAVPITVRIDDRKDFPDHHDRFNKRFDVIPGTNRIEIPLGTLMTSGSLRYMDLKKIKTFIIFSARPAVKTTLFVDYIRLI